MSRKRIVDSEALVRLIEIELVSQYRRFLSKRLVQSPKNCRYNSIEVSELGVNRICKCPIINPMSGPLSDLIRQYTNKPCNTLSHAKKCPLFLHYTGVGASSVVSTLTEEFTERLSDPIKRAASFKTLHTLSLILHENDRVTISPIGQLKLWFFFHFIQRKYLRYLLSLNKPANITWNKTIESFKEAIKKQKPNPIQED